MSRVTVVDYGAGNLLNVVRALEHCGADVKVVDTATPIAAAERLILPGVGAFGDCMQALQARGLVEALQDYVAADRLFLGICVGMQVMFARGEEFGEHAGLALLGGKVARIASVSANNMPHKIPHIGWNRLLRPAAAVWEGTLLEGQTDKAEMYFVHSYAVVPDDATHTLANVDYNGVAICAMVQKGRSYGCQFHPEKSGEAGLAMLTQFLRM